MVPIEPAATTWRFVPTIATSDGLLGVGADLEPGTMLAGYRAGVFPMPLPAGVWRLTRVAWWSPDPRGVIPVNGFHASRSLRRARRKFHIRVDAAFSQVVRRCADPRRPYGWITPRMLRAYDRLHTLGWAHSIEAWTGDGQLAGGVFGVAIGGLFAGESMFHRVRDASKVALLGLVELLRDEWADQRLVDVQWTTPHLCSLGAVDISREEYLARLAVALTLPAPAGLA
jgi:leucyl/phenylalanyl-tRNA--protein transferase